MRRRSWVEYIEVPLVLGADCIFQRWSPLYTYLSHPTCSSYDVTDIPSTKKWGLYSPPTLTSVWLLMSASANRVSNVTSKARPLIGYNFRLALCSLGSFALESQPEVVRKPRHMWCSGQQSQQSPQPTAGANTRHVKECAFGWFQPPIWIVQLRSQKSWSKDESVWLCLSVFLIHINHEK